MMGARSEHISKSAKFFISLGVTLGALIFLRYSGAISSPKDIVGQLSGWYEHYGYLVVFISALVEGIFVVNLYFPGSTAILLGGALASRNELSAVILVALIILGFLISYVFNYFLGKYGLYLALLKFGYKDMIEGTREKLIEKGPKMMLVSFFHPNLGSIVATGAGVIRMPFWEFFRWCLISLVVWDIFWGLTVYALGEQVINLLGSWLAVPFMIFWIALIFIILRRQSHKVQRS